jgi:hypothetical protein
MTSQNQLAHLSLRDLKPVTGHKVLTALVCSHSWQRPGMQGATEHCSHIDKRAGFLLEAPVLIPSTSFYLPAGKLKASISALLQSRFCDNNLGKVAAL